jgi:hypothetical protein
MWSKVLGSVLCIVPFAIYVCFAFFPNETWAKVPFLVLLVIMALAGGTTSALAVWYSQLRGHWGRCIRC